LQGYSFAGPSPIQPRGLFATGGLPGIELFAGDTALSLSSGGRFKTDWTWELDRRALRLHGPSSTPHPVFLVAPHARERERQLHLALSNASPADFVRRVTVPDGDTSRRGLFLPAPAAVGLTVTIAPAAVLSFVAGVGSPEFSELLPSDGCRLKVRFEDADPTVLFDGDLTVGPFQRQRLDLSSLTGRTGPLVFEPTPRASPNNDFCMVAEPVLHSRLRTPARTVVVFLDTVRADHLGLYGYHRPTTPRMDAFARTATVFEQARSVSPWTLPSSRALFTGQPARHYDDSTPLGEAFATTGATTALIAGNVFLGETFGMIRGWDHHELRLSPSATLTTDRALRWMTEHEGQPGLLAVHYMDAHLPYTEPEPYRSQFVAGPTPDRWAEGDLHRARLSQPDPTADERAYIVARYDQNLRWVDHEVGRLLDALSPQDTVVIVSDHGEEFWEHGTVEHGHTLYDEVLRVPLVIRSPGLPPGRVTEPVSLLDVVPTLDELGALGLAEPLAGMSLVGAAQGAPEARRALQKRPLVFGDLLYGDAAWGVLNAGSKWVTRGTRERTWTLATDPGEHHPRVHANAPARRVLEAALGTTVRPVDRYLIGQPDVEHVLELQDVEHAWTGDDPTASAPMQLSLSAGTLTVRSGSSGRSREVFVVPASTTRTGSFDGQPWTQTPPSPVQLTSSIQPLPSARLGAPVQADSDESRQALEALGYLDGNQ
jgi:arylsulfatase A-like enzyme